MRRHPLLKHVFSSVQKIELQDPLNPSILRPTMSYLRSLFPNGPAVNGKGAQEMSGKWMSLTLPPNDACFRTLGTLNVWFAVCEIIPTDIMFSLWV